ncbi:hypothetical protein GCM10007886_40080 [Methylobacterium gregans]|nr:hypothetical protein GCM10007886_40080 [Methylobacterium gregans]
MREAPAAGDLLREPGQRHPPTRLRGSDHADLPVLALLGNDGREEGQDALRELRLAHQGP